MAKNTYNKRMKASWQQGKGCKGDAEERQHAKKEIEDSIQHDVLERPVRHKGKRKRNKKASLEHTIAWYEQKIEEYERAGNRGSCLHMFRDSLRKARKRYRDEYGGD